MKMLNVTLEKDYSVESIPVSKIRAYIPYPEGCRIETTYDTFDALNRYSENVVTSITVAFVKGKPTQRMVRQPSIQKLLEVPIH